MGQVRLAHRFAQTGADDAVVCQAELRALPGGAQHHDHTALQRWVGVNRPGGGIAVTPACQRVGKDEAIGVAGLPCCVHRPQCLLTGGKALGAQSPAGQVLPAHTPIDFVGS